MRRRDNSSTKRKQTTSHWRDAVAGACAGAFAKTAVAPIERVKLLMQLQGSLDAKEKYHGSSAWVVTRIVYNEQGILAFWRGNTPNVLMQAGSASLNFMLMDWFKAELVEPIMEYTMHHWPSHRTEDQRKRRRALWTSFLSGGLAGGTAISFLYPIAFLRTRLAMDVGGTNETRLYPRGMRDAFCSTYKKDGIRGIYQGYGIALVGGIAYRAIHLGGYDALKTELIRYQEGQNSGGDGEQQQQQLTWIERVAAAQLVSISAATIMYPVDSVRRRLMMQAGVPKEQRLYRNSFECIRVVLRNEGLRGFYLGLGPNLVRSIGGAILLVGYDMFKLVI
jgi:solute carrier family 25 (mitochondrial adenine nucleotide translocator), member 4/5/6/31